MNMQNVKDLSITEGDVRTIHDSNGNLLWGRLAYNTKYAGDTSQQTYSGKNLLPFTDQSAEGNGISATAIDGNLRINGTCTSTIFGTYNLWKDNFTFTLKAGTYTFSKSGTAPSAIIQNKSNDASLASIGSTSTTPVSFTLNSDTEVYLGFYIPQGASYTNVLTSLQLELGSQSTSFEPYVGGTASPNPDYPQDVQVVTGEQTVTLSDGVNSQDYTVNLGSLELAKIGDYQDYIYKSGDDWYVHKAIGKRVFDGSENWGNPTINTPGLGVIGLVLDVNVVPGLDNGKSDYFEYSWTYNSALPCFYMSSNGTIGSITFISQNTTKADWTNWLSTHNTTAYFILATATDTQITDATLISQLNAIHEWLTRYGYNSTVSGNLPLLIEQTNLS